MEMDRRVRAELPVMLKEPAIDVRFGQETTPSRVLFATTKEPSTVTAKSEREPSVWFTRLTPDNELAIDEMQARSLVGVGAMTSTSVTLHVRNAWH